MLRPSSPPPPPHSNPPPYLGCERKLQPCGPASQALSTHIFAMSHGPPQPPQGANMFGFGMGMPELNGVGVRFFPLPSLYDHSRSQPAFTTVHERLHGLVPFHLALVAASYLCLCPKRTRNRLLLPAAALPFGWEKDAEVVHASPRLASLSLPTLWLINKSSADVRQPRNHVVP